jgi:hypothetical protein
MKDPGFFLPGCLRGDCLDACIMAFFNTLGSFRVPARLVRR